MDFNQLEESDRMKYEIAEELGLLEKVQKGGWKSLSSRETGKIGGILSTRRKAQEKIKVIFCPIRQCRHAKILKKISLVT